MRLAGLLANSMPLIHHGRPCGKCQVAGLSKSATKAIPCSPHPIANSATCRYQFTSHEFASGSIIFFPAQPWRDFHCLYSVVLSLFSAKENISRGENTTVAAWQLFYFLIFVPHKVGPLLCAYIFRFGKRLTSKLGSRFPFHWEQHVKVTFPLRRSLKEAVLCHTIVVLTCHCIMLL